MPGSRAGLTGRRPGGAAAPAGERRGATSSVEVWADDAGALARAETELEERGATPGDVTTVDDVRADLDASPAAWSLALSVLVGLAGVLVAMLVMIVATATTWRARATDLAALRMAGLPSRSLRRMELLGAAPGGARRRLAGAACGVVAAVWPCPAYASSPTRPRSTRPTSRRPWAARAGRRGALAAAAVLTALAVAASRWTARRASLSRIREVG